MFGFLNLDKPLHMTNHDVVAKARRKLGTKKIGHAGTLDPLATGVLILCVGAATRLSEYVMDSTKRYRARVQLGVTTTTYDAEGEVTRRADAGAVTRADVERALESFLGNIGQVPPMYSAIKQGGRKLYDLARAGETVERQPRAVRIDALTITEWQPPEFTLDVTCSAGTYIRSLAYDVGERLGVGAHLAGLVRTASGRFTVEDAVPLAALLDSDNPADHLIAPTADLLGMAAVELDAVAQDDILHGRAAARTNDYPFGTPALAHDGSGEPIAVVRAVDGLWKPEKVFSR